MSVSVKKDLKKVLKAMFVSISMSAMQIQMQQNLKRFAMIHTNVQILLALMNAFAQTRIQTDTLKSLCDWLALADSIFNLLRAPPVKQ